MMLFVDIPSCGYIVVRVVQVWLLLMASWSSFHFNIAGCGNNCSGWRLCDWLENWHSCCSHDFWKLCWIHNGQLSRKTLFFMFSTIYFHICVIDIWRFHLMLYFVHELGSFETHSPCGKTRSRSRCNAYFRIDSIDCIR